ncbi:MAG: RNA polymerase factor sigma-54 [Gammaproteobacteria bacterium]|nr:RNA polymerase factor sigma-54 [Gammaproteobacteria bacterium]MYF30037.1 RNA polymerase factor sigma-54 [Gammaproteobacteria bacterium]MYK46303.1 RNA polymerase factor sigma-54 [Gammaproteobacteria bacterium]
MKQTLALRMGQQLAMTPQLQQAIRLMQLSALELKTEVRQTIEANPMLDLVEEGDEVPASADGEDAFDYNGDDPTNDREDPSAASDGTDLEGADVAFDTDAAETPGSIEEIPEDLPVDVTWDDVYQPPRGASGPSPEENNGFEERNSAEDTLLDHLLWQLNLAPLSERDRAAAHMVIGNIDDDGMLTASAAELADAIDPEIGFEVDEMEAVIKLVQTFDPPGVAARDLRECLLLQLFQLPPDTPMRTEAIGLVRDHFALLAGRDFVGLARRVGLGERELVDVMTLIRSLNPRPGGSIGSGGIEYVEPDVLVTKRNGRWTVELNRDSAPRVHINDSYAGMIRRGDASAANQYLKDNLQDAKWFLKNLEYRNETLLKVAASIVERQVGFLEHGEEAMQPLVLADIAGAVDRHESTVSRVTTRKYMETPRGIFELKYFFSSHVGTVNGGEVSSTAIRALIRKLTSQEDPKKPLSDSKIAAVLMERDIRVARRTVAKYRESMAIPPSNERRRLV